MRHGRELIDRYYRKDQIPRDNSLEESYLKDYCEKYNLLTGPDDFCHSLVSSINTLHMWAAGSFNPDNKLQYMSDLCGWVRQRLTWEKYKKNHPTAYEQAVVMLGLAACDEAEDFLKDKDLSL